MENNLYRSSQVNFRDIEGNCMVDPDEKEKPDCFKPSTVTKHKRCIWNIGGKCKSEEVRGEEIK